VTHVRRPLFVVPAALAALATLVLGLVLAISAPAATSAPGRMPQGTPRHPVIVIKDFGYTGNLLVRPGVRVKVVNRDDVRHTLTHRAGGTFDTGPIPANGGVRFFVAPTATGSFPFGCNFHPEMSGTLHVRRVRSSG
jgi:plastocyanin